MDDELSYKEMVQREAPSAWGLAKLAQEVGQTVQAEQTAFCSRMNGLTVRSVEFLATDEGILIFKFTDGTEFRIAASGDDATSIGYWFMEAKNAEPAA